eukprot:277372_1
MSIFPFSSMDSLSLKHRIILTSGFGFACIIATDFVYGYQRLSNSNEFIQKRQRRNSLNYTMNQLVTGNNTSIKNNETPPISLKQSSTKLSLFKAPLILRNQLSFKDWLFQYFYQTRLNLYVNIFLRYVDVYYINYSRRNIPSLNILGKILIEAPSFQTMIDPPNLKRHEYVLNKLGITNEANIIFFSDIKVRIPYKHCTQIIEFIEVCCEITDSYECIALFWRVKCDKSGYFEMGDLNMNIEGFMAMVALWAALKVHVLVHAYGSKIIMNSTKTKRSKTKNDEMRKIHDDLRTAEVSMIALNHVAQSSGFVLREYMSEKEFREILSVNSKNMVWKHGAILQQEVLQNMKVVRFVNMARKKLKRLFTENKLYGMYDFEAAFLCIVCHGVDHYAFKNLNYCHIRCNPEMCLPDLVGFVTIFGMQNKPILRESRLKYMAKSKMLIEFANYLDSVDSELADGVNLINST